MDSVAMNDLKYDLEHTRQWAIAAEKELYEMKQRALKAEAPGLQAKVEELTKVIEELDDDVAHWQKSHTNVTAELAEAKEKLEEANEIIEELVRERDALYASLG
jgi:peptidoglycan hydrolase CwlO-like protein